jgi:hypothetical protein
MFSELKSVELLKRRIPDLNKFQITNNNIQKIPHQQNIKFKASENPFKYCHSKSTN